MISKYLSKDFRIIFIKFFLKSWSFVFTREKKWSWSKISDTTYTDFINDKVGLHIFNIWSKYSFVSYYWLFKWYNKYDHSTVERKVGTCDHTKNSTFGDENIVSYLNVIFDNLFSILLSRQSIESHDDNH